MKILTAILILVHLGFFIFHYEIFPVYSYKMYAGSNQYYKTIYQLEAIYEQNNNVQSIRASTLHPMLDEYILRIQFHRISKLKHISYEKLLQALLLDYNAKAATGKKIKALFLNIYEIEKGDPYFLKKTRTISAGVL